MAEHWLEVRRSALYGMPDVAILAPVAAVQGHPNFRGAKGGDELQAAALVKKFVGPEQIRTVLKLLEGRRPILSPVHAIETTGVNEIPVALAESVADVLDLEVELSVTQDNTVGHTGADGWHRLANPPVFSGDVMSGADYLLVDDFVGQGGSLRTSGATWSPMAVEYSAPLH